MTTDTLHPSITNPRSFSRTTVTADTSGDWPPAPTVIRHVLSGALAARVRQRMRAPKRAEVMLTETTTYGGYSEYTQENATDFTVACDGREVTFHPSSSTADWRQDAGGTWADSVFARFDAWLSVAGRPAELFTEWFVFDSEAGNFVRYRAVDDTILTRTLRERHHHLDHAQLDGAGDSTGREWRLDTVAPADDHGFARILDRRTLCYTEGLTITPEVAREVLEVLTDEVMPGSAWY